MATVAIKSGPITNRDATPAVTPNANVQGGFLRECVGTLEATAADDIGSTYRFCQIPSNARVSQILLYSDDQGTAGDMDLGIYQTTANGAAVLDADHFAAAVDINAAALNGTDITHESGSGTGCFGLEDAEKPLWQALGLTADPCLMYDVVGTLTEANTAGATITLKVRFVV
jgi:hypothetical protein